MRGRGRIVTAVVAAVLGAGPAAAPPAVAAPGVNDEVDHLDGDPTAGAGSHLAAISGVGAATRNWTSSGT